MAPLGQLPAADDHDLERLRIYWAEDVYAVGIGSWQWFGFFPDAVYKTFGLERRLARGSNASA